MKRSLSTIFQERMRHLRRGEGFSLTEVLMAASLLVVILAAAYGIWFGLQRTYGFTDEDLTAQAEARTAMNEMVEFIRTAREPNTSVSPSLDMVIVKAEPNLLICWTDVDRDAAHDLELVRFRVDTTTRTLFRDTSDSGNIDFTDGTAIRLVGSWVSNGQPGEKDLFTYVGMNGAPLTMTETNPSSVVDPTQIREVNIVLLVDVIMGKSPSHHELSTVVQPRNLRSY